MATLNQSAVGREVGRGEDLTGLEQEAVELFIGFLRVLGMPKSLGGIYGLLFVSEEPMAADDLIARLGISTGACSQGLKLLRGLGAVRQVYVAGDRRDFYVADLKLSRFASVFIRSELGPLLESSLERISRMEAMGGNGAKGSQSVEKIVRLRHWIEKGRGLLPWIEKMLRS